MFSHASKLFISLSPLVLGTTLFACGGNETTGVEKSAALYEGLYRLDRLTENSAGCDVEGPSVVVEDRDHMVIFSGNDFFGSWIRAEGCADPGDCRQRRADIQAGMGTTVTFSFTVREDKGDHLEGQFVTTGYTGTGSTCTDAQSTSIVMKRPSEGTARVEARSVVVDHPKDQAGFCTTNATKAAAAGQPCNLLQIIEGTRIEAL